MASINTMLRRVICLPIRLYRYFFSPFVAASCRFYPSCSEYALTAIQRYGVLRGGWKTIQRLARCHPWSKGGYDPVLPNDESY
ncbi:membrane protein insertion efficiency factor YidD [Legionella israelensis]|uniref:Putative membrane protein insertion efficiency factor n=1 Tax=Legionella israelensis TaxID=454 RepID=A0A0W0V1R4_9GAMM|nr:membrane protein insertion efficiency factor YidD [Legionella israelensis]KTD14047.1 putative membrane protein insertion efficiency factor [Legionella israelensis]QBR82999.1 membrane protein insertion efficiency factor YidD [Legionella israelensis]QBS09699.1 membrane protein insertion efficiency factor YidD [Legionella israelensis]SCY04609.1 hypothetical protein SAMN02746069_01102 [Legionella israelensis DSM 19235]STX60639.1 Protein YidD [Legionella israelensis]